MVQAYNYMLQSLPVRRGTKYPISKKSELRKVCNEIINLSKGSPFYKINLSKDNQEYTIGIKEAALSLISKLEDMVDQDTSVFHKKTVKVSDDSVISAKLIGEHTDGLPSTMELEVSSLAEVQVNRGKELMLTSRGLPEREYHFTVTIGTEEYELYYQHETRTENKEILEKVSDFINRFVPELTAVVEEGHSKEYGRLAIVSDRSGRFGERKFKFSDGDNHRMGLVDYFGLDRVDEEPTNAKFKLNGLEKTTATNTFNLENSLKITLQRKSEKPVSIKIVPDHEKILSAVDSILAAYHELIDLARNRTENNKEYFRASKLISEMKNLEEAYREELSACGLVASEDGSLQLDEILAVQAAEDGGMESLFTRENGFIAKLLDKAETIAINPMEYLDKTIVTYPNHEKNYYRNPYVTSIYSGLLFNSYC